MNRAFRSLPGRDAQKEFRRSGVWRADLSDLSRAPRKGEERPPWWLFHDEGALLIPHIEEAFRGVEIDDGISLEHAECLDDYRSCSMPCGWTPPWEELTLEHLNQAFRGGGFAFINDAGVRYYLPAFMRLSLRGAPPNADWSLLCALGRGRGRHLLDEAQEFVVASYLAFESWRDPHGGGGHETALFEGGWDTLL